MLGKKIIVIGLWILATSSAFAASPKVLKPGTVLPPGTLMVTKKGSGQISSQILKVATPISSVNQCINCGGKPPCTICGGFCSDCTSIPVPENQSSSPVSTPIRQ